MACGGSGPGDVTVINGTDDTPATVPARNTPRAIAVNPVTNKIYVANCGMACGGSGPGNVTVINAADNTTATVPAGSGPIAIAINPVTNKIYVANYGSTSNSVTVVNGADNTTAPPVPVGSLSRAIALNPVTNKIYVANSGSGTVTVINGADNTTETFAAGTEPIAIAVNPVTNLAGKLANAACLNFSGTVVFVAAIFTASQKGCFHVRANEWYRNSLGVTVRERSVRASTLLTAHDYGLIKLRC